MLRALEILLGLVLGCLGLLFSVGAVAGAVALFQKTLAGADIRGVDFLVGVAPTLLASSIFLAAWMLLRTPRAPRVARRWVRWLAVGSMGTTLILLVAIAVPNFLRFGGHHSPNREPKVLLKSIVAAEEGYFAEFGEYIPFDSVPSGVPGAVPVEPLAYPPGATTIGWSLDTDQAVYCRYAVAVGSFDATGERAQAFTAEAICDIDGDGASMAWGYVRPDRESGEAIPGPFGRCSAEGACDPSTGQHRAAVVGPCDEKSGSVVF